MNLTGQIPEPALSRRAHRRWKPFLEGWGQDGRLSEVAVNRMDVVQSCDS